MAQNGRFGLSIRLLTLLAQHPQAMLTSDQLGVSLNTSPVMVRRLFTALHTAGFLIQRKGPSGGAKLKLPPRAIGLGDVYAAVASPWPLTGEKPIDSALRRLHQDSVKAMNETTIASVVKRAKKA